MEALMIKAVLLRSNPTLLRQFTVPEESTLKDFAGVLRILLGWNETGIFSVSNGKETILPETKLKDAAEGSGSLLLTYMDEIPSVRRWTFRLMVMGTVQQEENYPRLIRARGNDLPQELESLKDFNRLQNYWSGTGYEYYNAFFRKFPVENYTFSPGKANLRLKQRFSLTTGGKDNSRIELDYRDTVDIRIYLENLTVPELRGITDYCRLQLPKGLKKEGIISYLTDRLAEPESLEILLDKMTLNQYRAFKKLLTERKAENIKDAAREAIILLETCRYAVFYERNFWREEEIDFTHQLFEAYEQWLDKTDEKKFLRLALLRSTITGCVELYGVLKKDDWKKWGPKIAGKAYTEKELETAWDAVRLSDHHRKFRLFEEDILYLEELNKEDVKILTGALRPRDFYLPTLSEIRQLENGGLVYPGRMGDELKAVLRADYGMNIQTAGEVEMGAYHSFQFGEKADSYADWLLAGQLPKKRGKAAERLKKALRALEPNTRQALYGGYTQNEMERMKR